MRSGAMETRGGVKGRTRERLGVKECLGVLREVLGVEGTRETRGGTRGSRENVTLSSSSTSSLSLCSSSELLIGLLLLLSGIGLSFTLCKMIKLWMAQSATGICAWISRE